MEITKIVITGGPCGGKTTALARIEASFALLGYKVITVPETATELIGGGISPTTCRSAVDFQRCRIKLQLEKERIYEEGARSVADDRCLLVCDRGMLDSMAYMGGESFRKVISEIGENEVELRDGYDAVFHMTTAAKGAEEFYTLENNFARVETVEQSRELDDRIISAWTGHPHFRVIDNSTDFEGKIERLCAEIAAFLGIPEPLETERKFLIEYPDTEWLESLPNCQRVEIGQTYLKSDGDGEVRVRQRGCDGFYLYYKTEKRKIGGAKRIEIEEKISREEYEKLLEDADTAKRQIVKTRYCLTYESRYFEIDVYPFWDDKAIIELELLDERTEPLFPPGIKIIKEVTEDESYKNSSLAKI